MTIAEYIKKLNSSNTDNVVATMLENTDTWSNDACMGYAAAAAIGAGLDHRQTIELLENMQAAFDNMTVDEAIELYQSDNY